LSDFAAQQTDFINKRQEGTGLWFIHSAEFAEWLHGSKQNIFCPGIPGAGKTMITSIVTDHLWKTYQEDDIGVAYLYCNYKRREEQKVVNLLAIILKQLIQRRPSVSDPVDALYKLHVPRGTRPSFDELYKSLDFVLRNYSRVFIIVDALDECTDLDGTRKTLLSKIRSLQAHTDIRLLVTSRPISSVTQMFEDGLRLEIRASDEDVKRYLEGEMSRQSLPVLRDPDLRQIITKSIVEAVDGM
jgi:Cdc6-like AAA superfamily ATPase